MSKRSRKHVWFETESPKGKAFHIKGDPNMAEETRNALGHLMDALTQHYARRHEPMLNDRLWDTDASGKTIVYAWMPQENITAYELALCMPIFSTRIDSGSKGHEIDKLPEAAKRHFERVG